MKTIYEALISQGYGLKRHTGDVGIEIETETIRNYEVPPLKFWNSHPDNSLRNIGKEFVLKAPTARGSETRGALEEWNTKIAKEYKLIPDSFTTSVHVHLNFLNNTWRDWVSTLATYYLLENPLVRYSGPDRLSNLFCLPLCDAEGELEGILQMIRAIHNLQYRKLQLDPNQYKYAANNLCNLTKLGTMEIRTMRGVVDIDLIERWINILLSIKDFATSKGMTPLRVLSIYGEMGPDRFAEAVFGDNMPYIDASLQGLKQSRAELIEKNLWYASKIATAAKYDAEDWGFPKPKKIFREKYNERLEAYSLDQFRTNFAQLEFAQKAVIEETLVRELNTTRGNVVFADGDI